MHQILSTLMKLKYISEKLRTEPLITIHQVGKRTKDLYEDKEIKHGLKELQRVTPTNDRFP
jgi:hypothetical protein